MKNLNIGQKIRIEGIVHNQSENGDFIISNVVSQPDGTYNYEWVRFSQKGDFKYDPNRIGHNRKEHSNLWVKKQFELGYLFLLEE